MKRKFNMLISILFIISIPPGCALKSIKKIEKKDMASAMGLSWTKVQGPLSWDKADEFCNEQGMRLPSMYELKAAYNSSNEEFKIKRGGFWSSESNKHYMTAKFFDFYKYKGYTTPKKNDLNFRCVTVDKIKVDTTGMIHHIGIYWEKKASVLKWWKAFEYCKKKGMRLPSLREMENSHRANDVEFEKNNYEHWADWGGFKEKGKEKAMAFSYKYGRSYTSSVDYDNYARCVYSLKDNKSP